jgi:hypothetical protein
VASDQLVNVVHQIVDLLLRCKQTDKATWLKEHLDAALATPEFDWLAFRSDLHRITIGMGSLSDTYLHPPEGGGLDEKEANRQLHELTQTLYELTK